MPANLLCADNQFVVAKTCQTQEKALIKSALIKGQGSLVKYQHPYLGTFKDDEWARLNWKHLDHHLRQFGV